MTNREAFVNVLQFEVSDGTVDMALVDADIDGGATYNKENRSSIEVAAIDVLMSLLIIKEETEGQLTIARDIEGIKSYALYLARKNGMDDVVEELSGIPKISAIRMW